jgi:hypothetical protein
MKVMRKMLTVAICESETLRPLGISFVEFSTYDQARLGSRSCNELDDCTKTAQGFPTPVDADEGKEPVFDFIPLACSRGQVAHRDRELEFVSQFL